MSVTYCGKVCEECKYMVAGKCPGCNEGPGHKEYGACDLAKCCNGKGYEKCEACKFNSDCYMLSDKENMPEIMANKAKEEIKRRESVNSQTSLLAYWINIMLVLTIPTIIAGVIMSQGIVYGFAGVAIFGSAITIGVKAIYAFGLVKISVVDAKYKMAAAFLVIGAILTEVVNYIPLKYAMAMSIVSLVATFAGAISVYFEAHTNAKLVKSLDENMSKKWMRVWTLQVIVLIIVVLNLLVSMMFPIPAVVTVVSVVATLAIVGVSLVASVVKILALHGTANVYKFADYHKNKNMQQNVSETTDETNI